LQCEQEHRLVFQVLPEHWLRGIDAAIDYSYEEFAVSVFRFRQREVAAFALERSGG
jgi:hypothetical protein